MLKSGTFVFCVFYSRSIRPAVQYCPARPRESSQDKAGCRSHSVAMVIEQKYSEAFSFVHFRSILPFSFLRAVAKMVSISV